MYKNTRKKAIKQIYKQPLFTLDKSELMSLISNIEKDLLAQKEDKKECKHKFSSKDCRCFYCGKEITSGTSGTSGTFARIERPNPSPLEIEEIETLKHRFMSGKNHCWRELSLQDQKINSLIRNQKKLYQFIKDKL